jgi:xanthine dehydrogenase small subunit
MTSTPLRQHTVLINGRRVSIEGRPAHTTLLDFLREQGLTGAKEGCAEGECGACTVMMVANRAPGSAYQAVNSCLMFLPSAVDREFYTVEALARDGELCEAQRAMAAAGGSQCGYCTPGFVMSLFAEQYRPARESLCDPHALGGNLCRCTGYRPIRDAALGLGPAPEGFFKDRLAQPAGELNAVEYLNDGTRFERPRTLEECLAIASQDPEAKWVAGATDLAVESNLRYRRWRRLISLEAVAALREFSETAECVRIGAALPLAEIERLWRNAPRAFVEWIRLFASPPIRNRATLGGNLATASPIGDSAPLLMAMGASVQVASVRGERTIPLSSFFTAYRKTKLEPGELIGAVEMPKAFPALVTFYKASKRRMDDISTVAAGLALGWDKAGRIERAVFAFGGVGPTPVRVFAAEEAAIGQAWNETTVARVQHELRRGLAPIGDHRGSAAYRLALAEKLVEKFFWEWRERAA